MSWFWLEEFQPALSSMIICVSCKWYATAAIAAASCMASRAEEDMG